MAKELTPREQDHQKCNELMSRHGFDYEKRRRAIIWAAKLNTCPDCSAPPYRACFNLADFRKGVKPQLARRNRQPHEDRIDWAKLLKALKERLGE